jgi:acyl-CoA synthetase (AMP-forming)/AMP-acid ligase II
VLDQILSRGAFAAKALKVLTESGVIAPFGPLTLARLGRTVLEWGTGPAGGFQALAVRYPDRVGIADPRGDLTFGEIQSRTDALAHALAERGVGAGDGVALMCRNNRYFVEVTVAAAKLGADVLYLNTAFAGPQLVEVIGRENPAVVVHDAEFADLLAEAEVEQRFVAWDDAGEEGPDHLEALISQAPATPHAPPSRHTRIVILTSGTTGTPKGAPRSDAGIDAGVALMERIPYRAGVRMHIAAPMFHTWGFAHMALCMLLGDTMVLRNRFDPEDFLTTVRDERCHTAIVIPVMLQRVLALDSDVLSAYALPDLKVVSSSGSALPGDLATRWMDGFGDNLYSTYGSTEVAYGSIATPRNLRRSPSTAGRPPLGTDVRILDDSGAEVKTGTPGRIFVRNSMLFEGYTNGETKDVIDGLMSTGDVGRFDEHGLLFVEGRDDEMIVSGGENVFPREIEDCLARHAAVNEAAALGVPDDDFGQRLRAFVVLADQSVTEDDLKAWVRDNLARYKVPREIVFVDELPRNATGKILKRELAER